jgi:glycogen synthase
MSPPGHLHRVLMTADAVGGVWNYALELSRGLGGHGIEVVLATMGPKPSAAQRAEAAELGNVTLCEGDFRLEWMEDPWDDVERAGDWLRGLEWRFAPDVVHLNGFVHGALPWSAPTVMVAHSCVCSWWHAVRGGEPPAKWNRYREAVAAGLRRADAIVAPTRAMLQALELHHGDAVASPRAGAFVIPNGRDPSAYSACDYKERFVLSVGRLWDEAKNARALAVVAPRLPWPVRVAGSTTAPDGSQRALCNVEALGRCPRRALAAHYANAAIYALPARYEPFGLSALEAALSGCALVLGDIPSLRENWDGAARFVPPEDHDALGDALLALIRDDSLRGALAEHARARGRELTAARMVDGYLGVYRRLLRPEDDAEAGPDLQAGAGRGTNFA